MIFGRNLKCLPIQIPANKDSKCLVTKIKYTEHRFVKKVVDDVCKESSVVGGVCKESSVVGGVCRESPVVGDVCRESSVAVTCVENLQFS